MQVHRDGDVVQWFSRQNVEHGAKSGYRILDPLIKARLRSQTCRS